MNENNIEYKEYQQFKNIYLLVIIGVYSLYLTYVAVKQIYFNIPFDLIPVPDFVLGCLWFMFAVATPFVFFWMNLQILVNENGVFYKYFPFHKTFQKIEFENIESVEVVTYRPIKDFGGWGIRFNESTNAMTVNGNQGVLFTLQNQPKKLLIGSQNPEKFLKLVCKFMPEVK